MSFNEEILKLTSTAPVFRDPEDGFSDDETRAKVDAKSNQFDAQLEFGSGNNKRFRGAAVDLSEDGVRYKGKKISRKQINEDESEEEEEEEDEEDDDDDEDEEEDEDEEGDEDEDEEKPKSKANNKQKEKNDDPKEDLKMFNLDRSEEIEKGKCVKKQLNFWDILLESRVKLQNVLNSSNQFPQFECFNQLMENFGSRYKENNDKILNENNSYLVKAINQLIELQQRLFVNDSETQYLLEELNLTEKVLTKKNLKRKRGDSLSDGEEDDEEEEEEDDEGKLDDDEDEDIYSDTDAENEANERKKSNVASPKFTFKKLKKDQFEPYLTKVHSKFKKYRDLTIQKWYDKTRLTTGKSFETLEKPILQQIEHLLMDRDRIVKRTQLKRSIYNVLGKTEAQIEKPEDLKDRHMKDYDEEIFDDQDFYNQLLRELIDRKSSDITDPIELSRRSIEMQKLRAKSKKVVDTKASKGRKLKFNVHKQLVNFMAPIYRSQMPDEARNDLFRSLFGGQATLLQETNGKAANGNKELEIDAQALFKRF